MNIRFNFFFKVGCLNMLGMIVLGARFGHKGTLDEEGTILFNKAQLYSMSNSIGFIACSLLSTPSLGLKIAAGAFLAGQLLFVSPLFYLSVKGKNKYLPKLMPVGGLAMMLGWLSLMFA